MPLILPSLLIQPASRHYHILPAEAEARIVQGRQLLPLFSRFSAFKKFSKCVLAGANTHYVCKDNKELSDKQHFK
jgi:hypothetical protein